MKTRYEFVDQYGVPLPNPFDTTAALGNEYVAAVMSVRFVKENDDILGELAKPTKVMIITLRLRV